MKNARQFLKPDQPSLEQVVEYLIERYRQGNVVEADRAIVVVPGARAGRRLVELLVQETKARKLGYLPPHVTTVGRLPELLYTPRRVLASDWVQQLAWCRAVQSADAKSLELIVPVASTSQPLEPRDNWAFERWLHLGELFCSHYRHLAAEGYSFADVARIIEADPSLADSERWQALAEIQTSYLRMMDGFELWDMQTARLVAVRQRECRTDRDIILVGTVDIPQTIRSMLDLVRERVVPLIHAPREWANRFDDYGTLIPDAWQSTVLPLPDERIHVVDGPADQACAVAHVLAQYGGQYCAEQIVVGVPDERLVPYLQRGLGQLGIATRWGPGRSARLCGPWRLLDAIAHLIESQSMPAWGALLRHPDLHGWLTAGGVGAALLEEFDKYCVERVPCQLDGSWPEDHAPAALMRAYALVTAALQPLWQSPRPLRQWCEPIQTVLLSVYGMRDLDPNQEADRCTWESCLALQTQLAQLQSIPEPLNQPVTSVEAIRMVLRASSGELIGAEAAPDTVEMLGWLDLLQDDAPATIVTSFNEGFVPTSVRTDAFLPNSLRARLGMNDNARRYARDAYTSQMLLASRREFDVIVARRAVDDEPLLPSRLLFATDDGELARRAMRLLSPPDSPPARTSAPAGSTWPEHTRFDIPRPQPLKRPIERLSATGVRAYLACPYRFYLAHVLGLCCSTDTVYEIDALQFGRLLHDVMLSFGESRYAHSKNPVAIRKCLDDLLDERTQALFCGQLLPAARVQIAQLQRRLHAFAEVQAERVREGWHIEHVEVDPAPVAYEVDGQSIQLIGRIDRIDKHKDGRVAILDYKTSESGKSPDATHRKRGEWIDLQLPMYRHLARGLDIHGPVELGFIALSSNVKRVQFDMAEWTKADLASADTRLDDVIRDIRAEKFWPPAKLLDDKYDDFAAICMTAVQEQPLLD